MRLLFINSFSSIRKKKLQIIGIILLVFLSTSIYTMMNMAVDRMEGAYTNYINEQNVEDLSLTIDIDYRNSYTYSDVLNIKGNIETDDNEQYIINLYLMCLASRNCTDDFLKQVDRVFEKYDLNKSKKQEVLEDIARKYNFYYEETRSKLGQNNDYIYRVMPYIKNKKINKPFLIKGKFPTANNEVTILDGYAKKNNLKIGSKINLSDKEYTIVGYAYASDYMYPIINISSPMFDEQKHNIVFMHSDEYKNFNGVEEIANSIKFKKENRTDEIVEKEKKAYLSMNDMLRIVRNKSPKLKFENGRIFTESFLYLLLGVSAIIILVIAKKRIDDERLQIGVLKALGYNRSSIALSYLLYPLIGGLVGGILGFTFGYFMHPTMTSLFISYYNVPTLKATFDTSYLLKSTLIPTVVLSILTFFIFLFMLRHKALYLLREGSNIKVNFISRIISRITMILPFKERLRISLANRSIGKLFIVSLSSFLTGLLIVLVLVVFDLFSFIIDKSFKDVKYDYVVNYLKPETTINLVDDLVLTRGYEISKVYDSNDDLKDLKERKKDSNNSITIEGIDKELKYFYLYDENNNKLNTDLSEDKIIINTNMSKILGLEIGDKIIFKNLDRKYTIVNITESFNGFSAYVDREDFAKAMSLKLSYNKIYSKDSKYSDYSKIENEEIMNIASIFSTKDLKRNMGTILETYDISLYVVMVFAAIMVFIIVLIIANIVIEENKKTISLMRVLGYKKKEINSIVLNMYTPFIIISYILSIPAMIYLLEKIVEILMKDIDFALPITISYIKAFIGLLILLVGYYLAMYISKRTLKRIPLSVALKRE
ncbi:MAG: ABC transporter permease [Bacilli bacterium]|nr:ABC transporter permease [Bacilli bacterium]